MPPSEVILNLPELDIKNVSRSDVLRIEASYGGEAKCIHCGSVELRKKDLRQRLVRHTRLCGQMSEIKLWSLKYQCLSCRKYFYQRFQGILPRARSTQSFRSEVFRWHVGGMSQRTLSRQLKLSPSSIERWTQMFLKLEKHKQDRSILPRVLGIDEHYFSKKDGFVTTLADLTKHCVFDLVLGRSESNLGMYLEKLKGKERVKVIVMDLSSSYRSIVQRHFPKAKIVADRFHVIRLVLQSLLETWKQLDPEGRKHRGLVSLMRRKIENLRPDQYENLQRYLREIPGLKPIYDYIQALLDLMRKKHQTAKEAKRLIPMFLEKIEALKNIPIETLKKLGETLQNWSEEIARMWRFTKTNSITEGLHTRMEELQRRAYGFRNFQNYRLRVTTLCGYRKFYL